MIWREGLQEEHSRNREPATRERKFRVKGTETHQMDVLQGPQQGVCVWGGAGEFRGIFGRRRPRKNMGLILVR